MSGVTILSSGIDTLHLSVRGELREGMVPCLSHLREWADQEKKPQFCDFHRDGPGFPDMVVRGCGRHGMPLWLSCPRFELFIGGEAPLPAALVHLHSAYIHGWGIDNALTDLEAFLRTVFFEPGTEITLTPSRVDLYVDTQGWQPVRDDLDRFITRAISRRAFEHIHQAGRLFTGFVFGRDQMLARIYNKTREIEVTGSLWPKLLWQDRDPGRPVWRIEFQFRRRALKQFGLDSVSVVIERLQALWEYGTTWLSLRRPTKHHDRSRWPEADEWMAIREASIDGARLGAQLVREQLRAADELRLVQGFVGYATSLAAMGSARDLELGGVLARDVPAARRYLAKKGEHFAEIVERKKQRRADIA